MTTKDVRIVTPVGRLAFCKNLFQPNDKGRYTLAVVFENDKNTVNALEPLKGLIAATAKEKWGDKIPSDMRTPIKEEKRPEMLEKYEFMKDRITLNATNGFAIPIEDVNEQPLFDGDVKAGDYVRLVVTSYAYDAAGNRGVGLNVAGVQWVKKGEAFYSRQSVGQMFADAPKVEGEAFTGNDAKGEGDFNNYGF